MSHASRRGSLVALTLVAGGCSISHNAVRDEGPEPITDMPRTAPSARELALRSIASKPPAPHLNAATIRRFQAAQAVEAAEPAESGFTGFGLVTPTKFATTYEPMPATPAAAFAASPAAVAAVPEPAPAGGGWISGGPWRDWSGAAQAQTAEEAAPPRVNDGQDPLRPRRRLELRFAYTKLQPEGTPGIRSDGTYGTIPGERQNYERGVTTLRLDLPISFPKRWIIADWKLATTFEVPLVSTDVPGPDGEDDRQTGIGDASAEAIMIPTPPGRFEWGFGAKASFPTARNEEMGTGRWLFSPTLIAMWHPKWMKNDGFWGITLRDTFDTGTSSDRAEVHYGTIQPRFQWNLGRKWFVATAPEILCDFRDEDRWYVPANLMIGTMLGDRWLISLDGIYAITNHTEGAEWTLEARLAWFF